MNGVSAKGGGNGSVALAEFLREFWTLPWQAVGGGHHTLLKLTGRIALD